MRSGEANAASPEREVVIEEHTYGLAGDRPLRLDLFRPPDDVNWGRRSAWLFLHGGGWRQGSKERMHRQARFVTRALGAVTASAAYRLSGEARFPAALEDARTAVRWLRENAAILGVDPDRIGIGGGSAGGHLAALVGTTAPASQPAGDSGSPSPPVAGVICFNGVFDLEDLARRGLVVEQCTALLGARYAEAPDRYAAASPLRHVERHNPPFLLLHGTDDKLVPFDQAEAFHRRLRQAGVEATLHAFAGAPHGFYQKEPWFEDAMQRVVAFIDATATR